MRRIEDTLISTDARGSSGSPGASLAVPATLAGLAALHGAWAAGWRWPGGTDEAFAERVIGHGASVPPAPATWAVAGLLAGAAVVVRAASGQDASPRVRTATAVIGSVFFLRGAIGVPVDLVRGFDDVFERLDIAIYSPLCLAIAAGTAGILRR